MDWIIEKLKAVGSWFLTWGIILLFVIGVMAVVEKCEKRSEAKHQKEVAADTNEFERFLGAKSPPSESTEDTASTYRKDHLLLIDTDNGKLDELFYELPTSVRAAKAAEVGTLVWIRWDAQTIGRYTTGGYATKTDCDLTVFDVARRVIVGRQHIEGEQPPQTISHRKGSSASWSKRPTEQVLGYLKGCRSGKHHVSTRSQPDYLSILERMLRFKASSATNFICINLIPIPEHASPHGQPTSHVS
jgi:electron transfer flavoprotein alpha subunit